MKQSKRGEFYGDTSKITDLEGITLTDTVYTQDKVDWHYHENAYFTFILEGCVMEGNKKERYDCSAGSLLFHNWQEPHYNIKPKGFTRGFHIEIEKSWFDAFDFNAADSEGSSYLESPDLKFLMYKIFRETQLQDATAPLSIQVLLLETLARMQQQHKAETLKKPTWVADLRTMLNDQLSDYLTLDYLSKSLDIHPVHLSRDFPKYFNSTLGAYIRKLKVEKALQLISKKEFNLTEIAHECGFSDQSHFTRCFKEVNGISPSRHRKILFNNAAER